MLANVPHQCRWQEYHLAVVQCLAAVPELRGCQAAGSQAAAWERLLYKPLMHCTTRTPQAPCCQVDLPCLRCRSQVLEQSLAWLRSEAVVHSEAAAAALAAVALLQELPSSQVRPVSSATTAALCACWPVAMPRQ